MNKKILKLVDWLQDNTDLAERLNETGELDLKTENYPSGEYAMIERWLNNGDNLDELINIIK